MGVAGRNNEEITSCFGNFVLQNVNCDNKDLVLWMDNSLPQNKSMTSY